MRQITVPVPVEHDSRTCFGINYFASEVDATEYAKIVTWRGDTYKGGFFDGMTCGRAPEFDYVKKGKKLYAVTVA